MAQSTARRLARRSRARRIVHYCSGKSYGLAADARINPDSSIHLLLYPREPAISEERARAGRYQLSGNAQRTRCDWGIGRVWVGVRTIATSAHSAELELASVGFLDSNRPGSFDLCHRY